MQTIYFKKASIGFLALMMLLVLCSCAGSTGDAPSGTRDDGEMGDVSGDLMTNHDEPDPEPASEPEVSFVDHDAMSAIPDDINQMDSSERFPIPAFGMEPQILKEFNWDEATVVISVPVISKELKAVAQAQGWSYILIVTRSSTTPGEEWGELYFYEGENQIYFDKGFVMPTMKLEKETFMAMTWDNDGVRRTSSSLNYNGLYFSGLKYNDDDEGTDTFTDTSYSLAEEHWSEIKDRLPR